MDTGAGTEAAALSHGVLCGPVNTVSPGPSRSRVETRSAVVSLPAGPDLLTDYRRLRRIIPAPYAAYLRCGELAVACSSPERFLRIDRSRVVESKPIKGTAPRSADLVEDEQRRVSLQRCAKTRAENLMIVDLLRNDLGRVSETGSICVPGYLETETYATVHQLVSTIRGTLRHEVSAIGCARACFPGWSSRIESQRVRHESPTRWWASRMRNGRPARARW
jgi:anthranilate/para-aminobenzoate synthase component I